MFQIIMAPKAARRSSATDLSTTPAFVVVWVRSVDQSSAHQTMTTNQSKPAFMSESESSVPPFLRGGDSPCPPGPPRPLGNRHRSRSRPDISRVLRQEPAFLE